MANLFINTRFDFAEEDRLTNALMSVLEHSDRRVLSEVLTLALGRSISLSDVDEVHLDLQVRLARSRPDALIRLPGLDVYVETKVGAVLDDRGHEQLRQHVSALRGLKGRRALVLLTAAQSPPAIVHELAAAEPTVLVRHLSWGTVLRSIVGLQDEFLPGEASHLLLRQLEEYLRHTGYFYFEGVPVTDMLDYAEALRRVRQHEKTTRRQLLGFLKGLADYLRSTSGIPTQEWGLGLFGGDDRYAQDDTNFDFVTAFVPDLAPHAHFRVLPEVHRAKEFRLRYYFTYNQAGHVNGADLVEWLLLHRPEIEGEVGSTMDFGYVSRRLFHISKIADSELSSNALGGSEDAAQRLGAVVGAFFVGVQAWLVRGIIELEWRTSQKDAHGSA